MPLRTPPTGQSGRARGSKEGPRARKAAAEGDGEPVGGPRGGTVGAGRGVLDQQASELLLAFARLMRGSRHDGGMPKHIGDLLHSGELAPRHVGVFVVIALNGPMSVSELARREGFALSTASLLVTQLAEAGLVERREDPQDRRRTLVTVAPEHRRESEEVIESKLAPLRRGLARMGRERAAVLVEALGVLAEEISRDVGDDCAGGDGRGVASSGSARAMSARAASTRAMSARAASARAVSRVGRPQPTGGSKITFPPSRAANERQEQRP